MAMILVYGPSLAIAPLPPICPVCPHARSALGSVPTSRSTLLLKAGSIRQYGRRRQRAESTGYDVTTGLDVAVGQASKPAGHGGTRRGTAGAGTTGSPGLARAQR